MDSNIVCPLVEKSIDLGECVMVVDCVDAVVKENIIPSNYKNKKKWKEICANCKYHNN